MRFRNMAATTAARQDEIPLEIDLYGEAKDTALYLAEIYGVSPGDVVARALGLMYFLAQQAREGRRVVSEDLSGDDRRLITINPRTGDAGTSSDQGR
jgi:hypothetical protein